MYVIRIHVCTLFDFRSYDEVMPYYIKSERANLREHKNSSWHGVNGELTIEDVPFR